MPTFRPALATLALSALLFTQLAQAAPQQQPTNTIEASPEANVATRLRSGQTLYIVDLGADSSFPGSHDAAYAQFVDDMKQWGQYQLVSSPATADLVLQLHAGVALPGSPQASPYLKLTFADPKTLAPLWVVTVPVRFDTAKKTGLFAESIQNATTQVKMLAGAPVSKQEQQAVQAATYGKPQEEHHFPWGLVAGGALLTTAFVVPLVLYKTSASNAKEHQDEFCREHNIPLSECAGG